VSVHRLEVFGHAVKPVGQRAKLVTGDAFHPRLKIATLNFFNGLFELSYRLKHEQIAGVQQHRCAHNDGGQHAHLQQMEQRSPLGNMHLDAVHERVNVRGKGHSVGAQLSKNRRFAMNPLRLVTSPVGLNHGEALDGVIIPRHKQGPVWVTFFQCGQAAVKFSSLAWQLVDLTRANGQRHAVRLHAHAPGFIDRCRATVELPRHP